MNDTRFAFAVAYMRTLENKMLTQVDIDTMLNMSDVSEAFRFLLDHHYGDGEKVLVVGKREIDELLKTELEDAWSEITEVCPKGAPIDVLLYKNDYQNTKTILKAIFTKKEWKHLILYPVTLDPEFLYRAIAEKDIDALPERLQSPVLDAYEVLARSNDGQEADIIIDKAAFAAMEELAEKRKNAFLKGWIQLWAQLSNMKMALRAAAEKKTKQFIQDALLPSDDLSVEDLVDAAVQDTTAVINVLAANGYDDGADAASRSISEFEKWCDNQLMDYVKTAQYKCFGFEPLLAFLYGKQTEIQAVRIVMYGLLNHIPKEILKERLREMYV